MNTGEGIIMQYESKSRGGSRSDNKVFKSAFSTAKIPFGVLVVKLGRSSLTDRVNTRGQMARLLQRMSLHSLAVKYGLSAYYVPHVPLGSMDRTSTEDKIPTSKNLYSSGETPLKK